MLRAWEERIAQPERKVGQQAKEIISCGDAFSMSRSKAAGLSSPHSFTDESERKLILATTLMLMRMCALNGVNRTDSYRWSQAPETVDRDVGLRDEIQKTAWQMPVMAGDELRRSSWRASHKRVGRPTREDNLPCLRGASSW